MQKEKNVETPVASATPPSHNLRLSNHSYLLTRLPNPSLNPSLTPYNSLQISPYLRRTTPAHEHTARTPRTGGRAGQWGRREVGACCQRPRVGGAAPAAGHGRAVVPSRSARRRRRRSTRSAAPPAAGHYPRGSALDQVCLGAHSPRFSWGSSFALACWCSFH